MSTHTLLVPASGPIQMFWYDNPPHPETLLRNIGIDGQLVAVEVQSDPPNKLWMCTDDRLPENPRAQQALVALTGINMRFHGPVAFEELEEEAAFRTIRGLS